ncbi:MAG: sensor histidine kinase, partial [Acidothermaceae bacterium]
TGLFAVCGVIVVAVSYALTAHLGASAQGDAASAQRPPDTLVEECESQNRGITPDKLFLAKCITVLEQRGAIHQRSITLSHLLQYSLITLAVVVALAAVLGWFAAGRALRPVYQITAAARSASEHNLSMRVGLRGPRDELQELADTFDDMLTRLQAAFESQRRFIASASHELRTPLAVMRATVDVVLAKPEVTPDDVRGMALDVRAAVDHAEHLIGALLILARNERGLTAHEHVDLATSAEDVLDTVAVGDCKVHATLETAPVSGDPVLLERLIANLVDNAVRYNIDDGDVWLSSEMSDGVSRVHVENTGPMVSPADLERIFQPFQRLRGRTSTDGYGLGLTIVSSIAAVHGGTVIARPRDGGGLSIDVTLPFAESPGPPTGVQLGDHVPGEHSSEEASRAG